MDPAAIAGAVLLLLVAAGVGFFLVAPAPLEGVDERTFCRVAGDRELTVILLDVTDRLSAVQQQTVRNRLAEVQASVRQFDRLEVFVLGRATPNLLLPVAAVCNPGDPAKIDEWTTGRKFIARKFTTLFEAPLDRVFATALAGTEADQSPIMEAVQAAAATTFDAAPADRGAVRKRLVILSDMLENSPVLSMYRGVPAFTEFAARTGYRGLQAELAGVEVTVFAIEREAALRITDKALAEFWAGYFAAQRATLVRWANLL